jgi:hypothetical protein
MSEAKPVLVYFPIAGRADLARLIAAAGGLEIDEVAAIPEGDQASEYGSPGHYSHNQ